MIYETRPRASPGNSRCTRLPRDAQLFGDVRDGPAVVDDVLDQQQAAVHGQTGVSVWHRGFRLW
jgi:hypothetical protein